MRRIALLSVVALTAAVLTLGARFLSVRDTKGRAAPNSPPATQTKAEPKPQPRVLPAEMRGIHVTMALASLDGKIDEYLRLTPGQARGVHLDTRPEHDRARRQGRDW
jgi:hypothetical protein